MSPTVLRIMEELADPLQRLVKREVDRNVEVIVDRVVEIVRAQLGEHEHRDFERGPRRLQADLGADGRQVWRGRWLEGVAYGTGSMVEHDGRLYRATDATTTTPTLDARGWQLVADVAH